MYIPLALYFLEFYIITFFMKYNKYSWVWLCLICSSSSVIYVVCQFKNNPWVLVTPKLPSLVSGIQQKIDLSCLQEVYSLSRIGSNTCLTNTSFWSDGHHRNAASQRLESSILHLQGWMLGPLDPPLPVQSLACRMHSADSSLESELWNCFVNTCLFDKLHSYYLNQI